MTTWRPLKRRGTSDRYVFVALTYAGWNIGTGREGRCEAQIRLKSEAVVDAGADSASDRGSESATEISAEME